MTSSTPSIQTINCKSCDQPLIHLTEIVILYEYLSEHKASHFHIPQIDNIVHHLTNDCPKFRDDTSYEEGELIVRKSINNVFNPSKEKIELFNLTKQSLDYIRNELRD